MPSKEVSGNSRCSGNCPKQQISLFEYSAGVRDFMMASCSASIIIGKRSRVGMKELFSTGSGILGISFDIGYYPSGKWQNLLLSLAHGVTGHNEGTFWQTLIALRDSNVLSIDLFFDVRERRRKRRRTYERGKL